MAAKPAITIRYLAIYQAKRRRARRHTTADENTAVTLPRMTGKPGAKPAMSAENINYNRLDSILRTGETPDVGGATSSAPSTFTAAHHRAIRGFVCCFIYSARQRGIEGILLMT